MLGVGEQRREKDAGLTCSEVGGEQCTRRNEVVPAAPTPVRGGRRALWHPGGDHDRDPGVRAVPDRLDDRRVRVPGSEPVEHQPLGPGGPARVDLDAVGPG